MLATQCNKCISKKECSIRYVNAKHGDLIFCSDGSQLVVNTNYEQKPKITYQNKNRFTLKVHYCERCAKFGKTQIMKIIVIDTKTKEEKMKQFNFNSIHHYLVLNFYDYVECPICNWYKFIKTHRG